MDSNLLSSTIRSAGLAVTLAYESSSGCPNCTCAADYCGTSSTFNPVTGLCEDKAVCPAGSTRDLNDGLCYTATREVVEAVCESGTPAKNELNQTVCFAPVVCQQGQSYDNVSGLCVAGCFPPSILNSFDFCIRPEICPSGFVSLVN